jgi:type I restriction enzyme R subunit
VDLEAFSKEWFGAKRSVEKLQGVVNPVAKKWQVEDEEDQVDYKSKARDFVKLYSFLSQLVPLRDVGLEKLFVFLRFLLPLLQGKKGENPLEVLAMVDMEKLAIRKKEKKDIGLKRGEVREEPLNYGGGAMLTQEEHEALSMIIEDLNTRFNTSFTEDEIMVINQIEKKISEDEALQQQLKNGSRHAVEATFRQVAEDAFEDLVDGNYKFYQKVSNDEEVAKELFSRLLERFLEGRKKPPKKK